MVFPTSNSINFTRRFICGLILLHQFKRLWNRGWDTGSDLVSGGSLNTGRRGGGGAGVSNTAALVWGGENIPPPTTQFTNTESYNGTAWTELNDLNTRNADQSFSGTQTAAIGGGGDNPDPNTLTESWNGSTWTEVADLNAARYNGGSIGFTASAHNFVGGLAAPVDQNNEFWNGTSWTEQNNLNTGRHYIFL